MSARKLSPARRRFGAPFFAVEKPELSLILLGKWQL
jgi:hypothetical protein